MTKQYFAQEVTHHVEWEVIAGIRLVKIIYFTFQY